MGEDGKQENRHGPVQPENDAAPRAPGDGVLPPVPQDPRATPPGGGAGATAGDENVIEVSDTSWEKTVEKGKMPVAVMFYSPACVYCRQIDPYFRTFAKEFRGSVLFARLNILVSPWTAERYGVRSTPTFKFFCDGRPVQEMVGAAYPAILRSMIAGVLVHGKECARNSTAIDYEITGYG